MCQHEAADRRCRNCAPACCPTWFLLPHCCSQCLECVELDYLLIRGRGWDQVGGGREAGTGWGQGCGLASTSGAKGLTRLLHRWAAVSMLAQGPPIPTTMCAMQVQNWSETLSGGEKQRLAMARLVSASGMCSHPAGLCPVLLSLVTASPAIV